MTNSSIKRIAFVGMQWGDEGKGKLIDAAAAASQIDYVVRYQGGHNAGHTVIFSEEGAGTPEKKLILHLLPSSIVHPHTKCVIANGVVVYLPALLAEIAKVKDQMKLQTLQDRVLVSRDCPVILPSHIALDQAAEIKRKGKAIGTTGRGIGPTYEDYYARRGIKLGQLGTSNFADSLKELMEYHNFLLANFYGAEQVDYNKTLDEISLQYAQVQEEVQIVDTVKLLQDAVVTDQKILFEGAQGSGLDVHHGTYPYVTSSATCIGGVFSGSGISHTNLDKVIGIAKIYTTRVGEGPFPTELEGPLGEKLHKQGHEFGSTTGRPRRCGWLDLEYLRRAVKLNGVSSLFLTKVDVLDNFEKVNLCVGYAADGSPQYEEFDGWQEPTGDLTSFDDLPQPLVKIITRIEDELGVEVTALSIGAARDKLIMRNDIWESKP